MSVQRIRPETGPPLRSRTIDPHPPGTRTIDPREAVADGPSLDRTIRRGVLVAVLALGGTLAWATLARLDSAALAVGTVVVENGRQTVQHLEGGIVAEILVREGAAVAPGDLLLRLDPTRSQSALSELVGESLVLAARRARLVAEREGAGDVTFPAALLARAGEPPVARILEVQRELFISRRRAHEAEVRVLHGKAVQAAQDIEAQRAVERATTEQLGYTRQELEGVQFLFDRGLERVPRIMQVRRLVAEIESRREGARARIEQARQELEVAEMEAEARRRTREAEVTAELEATEARLAEVGARLQSARDEVARTEVRAHLAGTVVEMRARTVGGVVAPGAAILDIVPSGEALTVDARVAPGDVDVVRAGQPARLRLTAFSRNRTPVVPGRVERVSADRLIDPKTGEAFYLARIRPDADALTRLDGATLVPGMTVETLITVGARRAIDYLVQPVTDSIARAMVEN
jgi:HlyD family type I secretion membrane fusion protein